MNAPIANGFAGRTIGDIARAFAGSAAVFRRHKLDFCCCGDVKLAEAASAKGVSLASLEAELQALTPISESSEQSLSTEALIDHIEARYHAMHRRQLPELIGLAKSVEAVDKPEMPRGLVGGLTRFAKNLDLHMEKEESILFPLMRRGLLPMIRGPISILTAEHKDHAAYVRKLETLTNNFEPADGASTAWRELNSGLHKFADELIDHIHVENNILFARFPA